MFSIQHYAQDPVIFTKVVTAISHIISINLAMSDDLYKCRLVGSMAVFVRANVSHNVQSVVSVRQCDIQLVRLGEEARSAVNNKICDNDRLFSALEGVELASQKLAQQQARVLVLQMADGFSIEGILGLVRADNPNSAGLKAGLQEVLY